jgi:hypothetical protein
MGSEMMTDLGAVVRSQQAVLCPDCGVRKTEIVFLAEGGARCVDCNDADMLTVVRRWRAGGVQDALTESLERYSEGEICVS